MSEYQYYEFQAIDGPLTDDQLHDLRGFSSRAEITPTSFAVTYNWGDFKGDPVKWMEKYFDAFVYVANWGTRWFMLRIPRQLLNPEMASAYCIDDNLSLSTQSQHSIISFRLDDEEPEWTDGEGWLPSLIPLRSSLIRGDYRSFYLGWLSAIQGGDFDDDTLEPPVPAGLGKLDAPLRHLADFLRIDSDLIAAAVEHGDDERDHGLSKKEITEWVANLPLEDKDAVLTKMIADGNPYLSDELRQRALRDLRPGNGPPDNGRRTAGQLLARAAAIAEKQRKLKAERAEHDKAIREREQAEKRKRHLESLQGKESDLWMKVNQLVGTKQAKGYDDAVSILHDLRDMASVNAKSSAFFMQMENLINTHESKRAFVDRLRKAKLLSTTKLATL